MLDRSHENVCEVTVADVPEVHHVHPRPRRLAGHGKVCVLWPADVWKLKWMSITLMN